MSHLFETMKTATITKSSGAKKAGASVKKTAAPKTLLTVGGTSLEPENAPLDPEKFLSQFVPLEEEIASRAYKIWQEQGCPEGCEDAHWRQAQKEIASLGPRGLTA